MAAPKEGAFTRLFTDICGIVDAARTRSEIVSRVATQLSWSHIVEILPLKDEIQRAFSEGFRWTG